MSEPVAFDNLYRSVTFGSVTRYFGTGIRLLVLDRIEYLSEAMRRIIIYLWMYGSVFLHIFDTAAGCSFNLKFKCFELVRRYLFADI